MSLPVVKQHVVTDHADLVRELFEERLVAPARVHFASHALCAERAVDVEKHPVPVVTCLKPVLMGTHHVPVQLLPGPHLIAKRTLHASCSASPTADSNTFISSMRSAVGRIESAAGSHMTSPAFASSSPTLMGSAAR